jgi:SAM-dependent methyltransferase
MTSRPDPEELASREENPAGERPRAPRESDRIPTAAEGGAARREPRGLVVAPSPPIAGTPIVTIVAPTVEVSDADATTRMPALNADMIQLPEDSWTPFAPTAIDRHYDALASKPGPKRYNSETTVYTPIPSETDNVGDSDRLVIDVPPAASERFSPLPAPPSPSLSAPTLADGVPIAGIPIVSVPAAEESSLAIDVIVDLDSTTSSPALPGGEPEELASDLLEDSAISSRPPAKGSVPPALLPDPLATTQALDLDDLEVVEAAAASSEASVVELASDLLEESVNSTKAPTVLRASQPPPPPVARASVTPNPPAVAPGLPPRRPLTSPGIGPEGDLVVPDVPPIAAAPPMRPRSASVPPMPPRPRSFVDASELGAASAAAMPAIPRPKSIVDAGELSARPKAGSMLDSSELESAPPPPVRKPSSPPPPVSAAPPLPARARSMVDAAEATDFPTDYGEIVLPSSPEPVAPPPAAALAPSSLTPSRPQSEPPASRVDSTGAGLSPDSQAVPSKVRIAAPAPVPLVLTASEPGGFQAPAAESKRKARPWWEELFNDDFLRASPAVEGGHLTRECDFIDESLALETGAAILDLGCGTGEYAIDMARRGYQMVGYDLSLSMLARASDDAQERNLKINFLQGDMREMPFEDVFDGAYCWNTSFGYFDETQNQAVIARVHKALKRGGQFLLDVINRDFVAQDSPSSVWFQGDGCICMDEMNLDWITSRMKVKRTMMIEGGRSRELEYSIRVYALHELGKMLHDAGFRVAEVSGRTETPGVFFGGQASRILILAEKR